MSQSENLLLGIDVGGTFTDVVVFNERQGDVVVDKVASTPAEPSAAVIGGIRRLSSHHGLEAESISVFAHGSTIATNAMLEMKLPATALLVTSGFRDVLEIATQVRHNMFDLTIVKVPPLVPRRLVFEVEER